MDRQISLLDPDFSSFVQFPKSGVAGSHSSSISNFFAKQSQRFPWWLCQLIFPSTACTSSLFSTSVSTLVIFCCFFFFNNSHAHKCQINLLVVLICISMMSREVKHLFMHLLVFGEIASFKKCLFSFLAQSKIRLFEFLLLSCRAFLHYFGNGLFIRCLFCKYFLPFRRSPFGSVVFFSFVVQKLFELM